MTKDVALYVAPDGGWGWVVVVAYALNNIITIPIIQGFGMVYNDEFKRLNISATQSTVIINVNQAFGMILGMMNGPLIRIYGYRKISIIGSLFYATGIILTSFGTTFIHFVITYGMMASLGLAMTTAACSLAVNSFFKEKRGRAMGISMTITGLGPILMPQLVSVLLPIYDSGGTMLILGALSLHGLIGSSLLQPLKWHAKRIQVKENKEDDIKSLLIVNDFSSIVIVAVGLGIAKGIRTVYMTLVIPSHVSLEKLTSASSIQSLVNGTLLIVFGPILGLIRDITGSYLSCVILINFVTAIAVVMWLSEFAIIRCKNQNKRRKRKLEPA
ncbi:unnamed protein product [Trichogramma brassicae]|uniref:Major facilitator superfamily (MFS) profile domain-containing protein n=1 Tax=Trichogramma brassicae TaxID=86971 RepID=A0A6H5I2L2_9HYME|nr:unnamed protein product [Trichogramma brassicae]